MFRVAGAARDHVRETQAGVRATGGRVSHAGKRHSSRYGIRENRDAVAETIENNVRRIIIDETAVNPKYYEKMSELLDALINQRKQEAIDYKAYLEKIVALTRRVSSPVSERYPPAINSPARRALYDKTPKPAASG